VAHLVDQLVVLDSLSFEHFQPPKPIALDQLHGETNTLGGRCLISTFGQCVGVVVGLTVAIEREF
jgi:hypothetical protein